MKDEVKHMAARQANERVTAACTWCRRYFKPRIDGGRAQRFCRPACRRAFEAASRRFVAEAISSGALTLDDEAVQPCNVSTVQGEQRLRWRLWAWRNARRSAPASAQLTCESCLFGAALQFGAAPRT